MEEEENDTEPDLDALAASFADDQPDLPHADSVQVESFIDQEVMRIQPNTQEVNLDRWHQRSGVWDHWVLYDP